MSRQSSPSSHPGFSGDSLSKAWVLGSNGTLWYELGPWGNVPPPRQQVGAGSVLAFSPIGQTGQALVLGRDGRLWLNTVGQSAGPEIDGNVAAFDGNVTLGQQLAYVLGKDGSLWLERGPWGTVPPSRQIVDRNVQAFQTVNANQVYVLGDDGNLWLESGPWGVVPPSREKIGGGNIVAFQALASVAGSGVFVLNSSGDLYLNTVGGGTSGPEVGGGDILAFDVAPGSPNQVYVLDRARNVWLNTVGQGRTAPQIDANAVAIQAVDNNHVYVLGANGNLWLEEGPWGAVPPARQLVDGNVGQVGDPSIIVINSYPNISGLNGKVTLTIEPSGEYSFVGGWSPSNIVSGGVAQDVSLILALRDAEGAVWTFSTSGTVPSEGSYSFNNSGSNASMADSFANLEAGYSWYDSYNASWDWSATWQTLESDFQQAQQKIQQIEQVVGTVAAIAAAAAAL